MDILKEKVSDNIVIEMFREFPLIIKVDDLKRELVNVENYNKTITIESIAWAFYKTNAKMFNYKIEDQEKIDKVIRMLQGSSIYVPLDKSILSDFINKEYINITIDGKSRNIPVTILEFFIHDKANYQNIINAFNINEFKDSYQESPDSFLSDNNYMFKNYIAYLIKAYQELYKLLKDKNYDFSNDDNIKLSLLNKFLSFNELTNDKIMNVYKNIVMNVSEEQAIRYIRYNEEDFFESSEEINIINGFKDFLSEYNGNDLEKDAYNYLESISNKVYDNNFYVLFVKMLVKVYENKMLFSDNLVNNVNKLFYNKSLDQYYQTEFYLKFGGKSLILEKFIYKDINPDIYDYIDRSLPEDITDNLEKSIAIYVLLVSIFRHNGEFIIYENESLLNDISSIGIPNNEIVCWEFALIYYKLLKKYNIDVDLNGIGILGMHVDNNVIADNIPFNVDPISFRTNRAEKRLSDIARAQFGLLVSSIKLLADDYFDKYKYLSMDEISKMIASDYKKLDKTVENVYKKLGKDYVREDDFVKLVNTYNSNTKRRLERNKQIKNGNIYHTKEDIDYRISTINYFYNMNIKKNNIEKVQFMTKYINMIFSDFESNDFNFISLIQRGDDNKSKWLKLIVVNDSDGRSYYYVEKDNGFNECSKEELVYYFKVNNISLKSDFLEQGDIFQNRIKK